ncbi:MAG: HAD-IIIA family hydrolase [Hyphomonadaceae bacterium]|nr:HAD-IIIA family hydrolase [Hyphomonadaceae bacterium]
MIRQAVILVGGRGTRLGEAARDYPKPLVPIAGDVRFFDYLIEDIARHGVEDIVLLAGHLADRVSARYAGRALRGARVRVIVEPAPAGTAGALRHVADDLDDVFLLTNGDSLLDMNYLALARALGPHDTGSMALRRVPDAARYGRVEARDGRVVGYHEKDASFSEPALISAGIYILRRAVLDHVGEPPCSLETDVFPKLVATRALACAAFEGNFIYIGLPETLEHARATLPDWVRRGAAFFDRDGTLIRDDGYTHKAEDLRWQPGAVEAIRRCNESGRLVIVVTNQAGIARGLYDEAAMHRFHAFMQDALRAEGAHVDAFYYCPYHGDGVVPRFAHADHPDRKPNPGMLRRAFLEWRIDPARSFMIGDTDADVAAGEAIGVRSFKVAPGGLADTVSAGLQQAACRRRNAGAELKARGEHGRAWLFEHALPLWWRNGYDQLTDCFHERLGMDGAPVRLPRRMRVQARQTLVYARAGRMGWDGPWREATEAGARVLLERGLREDGGVRHLLSTEGKPQDERRDLYDHAFIILGLAEAAIALGNRPDLTASAETLARWTEQNWAHPAGGLREGEIVATPPRRQNPHMHWLEANLALHEASGARMALDRAGAMAALFEHKLFDAYYGVLPELFDDAWRPLPDERGLVVEPGHAFEWSWLLHRWAALGGGDLGVQAERLRVHGELYGVARDGAIHDEVYIDGRPRTTTSRLWPHTERIKANAVRFEQTRDDDAAAATVQAFDMLMHYCDTPTPGLWRDKRCANGRFTEEPAPASSLYHIVMALFELWRITRAL